jgi:PAS domain S-box-containing protein
VDVNLILLPWGEKEFICAYARDITEKKALMESLRFTQFAMDNAPEWIIWVDSEGNLIYANSTICQVLSYTRDELQAMNVYDINPVYDRENWRRRYANSRKHGTLRYDSHHRARDGTIIPVGVFVKYICFDGKEYFCAFLRYPGEQKQTVD